MALRRHAPCVAPAPTNLSLPVPRAQTRSRSCARMRAPCRRAMLQARRFTEASVKFTMPGTILVFFCAGGESAGDKPAAWTCDIILSHTRSAGLTTAIDVGADTIAARVTELLGRARVPAPDLYLQWPISSLITRGCRARDADASPSVGRHGWRAQCRRNDIHTPGRPNTAADIATAPITARPSWILSAVEVRNAGRRILPT